MTFHRILLLNRNHIGDCLFTTPAIRALRRAYPEAVLVAAVPPANHDLLASNPCLSEVLVRPLRGISEQLQLLREVRRRQFDLVISFQEKSMFYAALARLSGARLTVSLQHWRTRPFYHRIVPANPDQHEVEKYHAIAQAVLAPFSLCPPRSVPLSPRPRSLQPPGAMELHVSREHRARADAVLSDLEVAEDAPLVGINPGATLRVKRWPVERFAAVGRELVARHDVTILLFGGPEDEARAAAIASAVPDAVSAAGRTRLGETAALLRRCRLLISGDTGPLHMAVALGVPSVGLFGPTNPGKYGPWSTSREGRHRATVLRHPQPCGQCRRPCVHTISVEECLAAADAWLSRAEGVTSAGSTRREVSGVSLAGAGLDLRENG
jgi:ADP-heptose:LPS heptosyltransferase